VPYPYGATILVKATEGPETGKVVSQVAVKRGQAIFRVTLAPGTYSDFGKGAAGLATTVTVRAGHYTRAVVQAGHRF